MISMHLIYTNYDMKTEVCFNRWFDWKYTNCWHWSQVVYVIQSWQCCFQRFRNNIYKLISTMFNHMDSSSPFHIHGLIIPTWISNCIHWNVRGEITSPFLNFNGKRGAARRDHLTHWFSLINMKLTRLMEMYFAGHGQLNCAHRLVSSIAQKSA